MRPDHRCTSKAVTGARAPSGYLKFVVFDQRLEPAPDSDLVDLVRDVAMNIVTPRTRVCGDIIQQIFIGKGHTQARQIAMINVLIKIRILTYT